MMDLKPLGASQSKKFWIEAVRKTEDKLKKRLLVLQKGQQRYNLSDPL
jgi:hypothetical protein